MNGLGHFMAWWLSKYAEPDTRPFPKKWTDPFLICSFLLAIESNLSVQVSRGFWMANFGEAKDHIRAAGRI
jgi:hypothetical protein